MGTVRIGGAGVDRDRPWRRRWMGQGQGDRPQDRD